MLPRCEKQLGPIDQYEDLSWDHGNASVWLLRGVERVGVLKVHRTSNKHQRERDALKTWGQELGQCPALLAEPGHQALLLSYLEGRLVEKLDGPALASAHRQAGAWLRTLHEWPHQDDDPLPLHEALKKRALSWISRARGHLDPGVLQAVRDRVGAFDELQDIQRVPCHRDFSPRNWIQAPDGTLGIIDFEHARGDLWLQDLDRITEPSLRQALLEGYGRVPSDAEEKVYDLLSTIGAVSTVVWAKQHGDLPFEAQGRSRLDELLSRS